MKLKKILHSLTSFVTIFALTSGIIITYAPAGAEDLTVDDIKDRIEQIKQDNAQRRDEIDRIEGDITDKQENLDKAANLLNEQKELVDYYYNLVYYKNQDIAFYLSRVGAPACVAGFEEVVAMGAKKFVMFGSCGVLDDEKVKDNMIIPVSAVRDEGTSYHYIAPSEEIKASEHSIRILQNVLEFCGYSYVKGKTWTSDAIYRETIPAIEERRQEGCLAVEMECASMLAVSQYRQVPFIQFLYGADSLSSEKWEIRDLELYGLTNAEKYMLLAFECGLAL